MAGDAQLDRHPATYTNEWSLRTFRLILEDTSQDQCDCPYSLIGCSAITRFLYKALHKDDWKEPRSILDVLRLLSALIPLLGEEPSPLVFQGSSGFSRLKHFRSHTRVVILKDAFETSMTVVTFLTMQGAITGILDTVRILTKYMINGESRSYCIGNWWTDSRSCMKTQICLCASSLTLVGGR
jgi:hypothetical protein